MNARFIADLSPLASAGIEYDRGNEIGCNYRGRLDCIRGLVDKAKYHDALYELNQLTRFIRVMNQKSL